MPVFTMQALKISLYFLLLLEYSGFFLPLNKRFRWMFFLPVFILLLCAVHLLLYSYRWQMVPVYLLAVLSVFIEVIHVKKIGQVCQGKKSHCIRIFVCVGAFLGIVVLIASVGLDYLFPVRLWPKPTGPYNVGTTKILIVDNSRPEILTARKDDYREIMVQVWYPGRKTPPDIHPVPYWENGETIGAIQSRMIGLPSFLFQHISLIQTHSYRDIPLADVRHKYPVILFSPGFNGLVNDYTMQMENLASHGYVTVAIAHTYETPVVIFPDGRVILYSQELFQLFQKHAQKATPLWQQWLKSSSSKEREGIVRQILTQDHFLHANLRNRTEDVKSVITELEKINLGKRFHPIFTGRLDMSLLGIFGHSLGGATAGQVCFEDERCKAGVNLDGLQAGDLLERNKVPRPFMVMYSEVFSDVNHFVYRPGIHPLYVLTVRGSTHIDYTDNPFLFPITRLLGSSGSIFPLRMSTITNEYLVAFFDQHLKGRSSWLLKMNPSIYPEVTFQIHRSTQ